MQSNKSKKAKLKTFDQQLLNNKDRKSIKY